MEKIRIQDDEKSQAVNRLTEELEAGQKSVEEKGWLTLEEVEEHLGVEAK